MIYYTIKENYSIDNHNNPQQIDSTLNSVIIVGNKAGSTYIGDCLKWSYTQEGLRHFGLDGHHLQTAWFYKSMDKQVWNNLHKLCVTRDPYSRFLSCWTFGQKISEIHRTKNPKHIKYFYEIEPTYEEYRPIKLKTTLEDMTQKDWQESFEDFCIKFKEGEIEDGHAHPMWNEFGIMPHEEFIKVKLTELHNSKTFNDIFNEDGNQKIDDYRYEGRTLEDSKNPSEKYLPNWKDYYNDNTKEIVYNLYKKDFEMLNYSEDFNDY